MPPAYAAPTGVPAHRRGRTTALAPSPRPVARIALNRSLQTCTPDHVAYLLAALFLFAHALVVRGTPGTPWASYAFLIAAPVLAGAACAWRARRGDQAAAEDWLALAVGMGLWAGGMGLSAVYDLTGGSGIAETGSLMLYVLYGVPLMFTLANVGRERTALRLIDAALATVLGLLYFIHIHSLTAGPQTDLLSLRLMLDIENVFIAWFAVLRYLGSRAAPARDYFRELALYAVVYLLVAAFINHFTADADFSGYDTLIDVPFLLLAARAISPVRGRGEIPASPRLNHIVRAGSPLVLPIAMLVVSALVVRHHLAWGVAGFIIATLGAGGRGILLQVRAYEERDHLNELARIDELTGIANRRQFEEALAREWRRAQRTREPLSLLLIDVDHFKALNDADGHPAGDRILRQVAVALSACVTRSTDLVARYGGEEFAVLLPSIGQAGARTLAERMRETVEALALASPAPPGCVTVSIGVAGMEDPEHDAGSALIARADRALYAAKAAGRNRVGDA